MITPEHLDLFSRLLNVFENDSGSPETDYRSVYLYKDGTNGRRQVTLARGFTDDGGNLKKVVQRYIAKGGKLSKLFTARLDKFGRGLLTQDQAFIKGLVAAGDESVMKEAQEEIFKEAYLQPAINWGQERGFVLPLSYAVIVDSFLHSGTMLGFLQKRFTEPKPSSGGNEKTWILEYTKAREAWLSTARPPLPNTVYRTKFFLQQINAINWSFARPITCRGKSL